MRKTITWILLGAGVLAGVTFGAASYYTPPVNPAATTVISWLAKTGKPGETSYGFVALGSAWKLQSGKLYAQKKSFYTSMFRTCLLSRAEKCVRWNCLPLFSIERFAGLWRKPLPMRSVVWVRMHYAKKKVFVPGKASIAGQNIVQWAFPSPGPMLPLTAGLVPGVSTLFYPQYQKVPNFGFPVMGPYLSNYGVY